LTEICLERWAVDFIAAMVAKAASKKPAKANRRNLRLAFVLDLKQKAQAQRGNKVDACGAFLTTAAAKVPIHQRAGAPLISTPADPAQWKTVAGRRIMVDFSRVSWLPDDWGQGVKITNPISRSRPGYGGTYTVWVSPDGQVFYHKKPIEQLLGRTLGPKDGFNGQLRMAQLQGKQTDESKFFALLSSQERKNLVEKDEFHFCVISARRTNTHEGLMGIATVQAQFEVCNVHPTWYVDRESLNEYKKLGLKAVVGGKLVEARNKALRDAENLGKVCVQVSDDISAWEYHDGKQAKDRSDEAANAAYAAATCHVLSPVSAARFMLAKMRSLDNGNGRRPRLAGVYPLATCSRAFGGRPFSARNFIIGDFFVADHSSVHFDPSMTLKEDYDFTCAHIQRHGSVLRCNRLTIHAKHQTNAGGACSYRDKKGVEERKNIEILQRKYPGVFRMNPKRANEVVLQWPGGESVTEHEGKLPSSEVASQVASKVPSKVPSKVASKKVATTKPVKKADIIKKTSQHDWDVSKKIILGSTSSRTAYIRQRCESACGRKILEVLGIMEFQDAKGVTQRYQVKDLSYDLKSKFLSLSP